MKPPITCGDGEAGEIGDSWRESSAGATRRGAHPEESRRVEELGVDELAEAGGAERRPLGVHLDLERALLARCERHVERHRVRRVGRRGGARDQREERDEGAHDWR